LPAERHRFTAMQLAAGGRHCLDTMTTPARDEVVRTARDMRADVKRVTGARALQWVIIHDIAGRLGLTDELTEAAVRHAIEQGWLVADGEPPHSVRLSAVALQHS
jgi:hypothetical protein